MIKTRCFPEHNYKAIYHNGKTLRIALNPKKPIDDLKYPEFYDVKITGKCHGNCPWCYQNSLIDANHYNVLENITSFFGILDENQKPFQVAIGGGEPTLHPEFIEILKAFYTMGITPNYTTNGMHITDELIKATQKYCGGVAISCHPHLTKYWNSAFDTLHVADIKTNFHIIISDKTSVDDFLKIYAEYKNKVEYFVLLPHTEKGRAKHIDVDSEYLFSVLSGLDDISDIAFGANFYPDLKSRNNEFQVSLYEPEIFSKYLDMKDMKIYGSSFE